ncbi:MAG: DUF1176 domain-containing protein [Acidobacteria bacterium]|nr:DUF1176 domain-containing protein [Acidobacteriota bacterium]
MDVCEMRGGGVAGRASALKLRAGCAVLWCLTLTLLGGCSAPGGTTPGKVEGPKPEPTGAAHATPAAATATATPTASAAANNTAGSSLRKSNLSPGDRRAWRGILKWPDECEEAFEQTMGKETAGLEFYELSAGRYLVEIVCTTGAYQGYQFYSYLDETKSPPAARLLTFETYESQDEDKLQKTEKQEMWGLPEFDAKTKRLRILNKYRGPGDCGSLARYEFPEGSPVLKEFREKSKCDGKGAGNPEKWQRISP